MSLSLMTGFLTQCGSVLNSTRHLRLLIHFSFEVTTWIANTDFGLDPKNRVVQKFWCIRK